MANVIQPNHHHRHQASNIGQIKRPPELNNIFETKKMELGQRNNDNNKFNNNEVDNRKK